MCLLWSTLNPTNGSLSNLWKSTQTRKTQLSLGLSWKWWVLSDERGKRSPVLKALPNKNFSQQRCRYLFKSNHQTIADYVVWIHKLFTSSGYSIICKLLDYWRALRLARVGRAFCINGFSWISWALCRRRHCFASGIIHKFFTPIAYSLVKPLM